MGTEKDQLSSGGNTKKDPGTVFLTFIVEKDGAVSNVTIVKGVDPIIR